MARPHIVVNTRLLLPGTTEGIARYAIETLKRMTQRHPEVRFSFLFDRPFSEEFIFSDNIEPHVVFPPARHPLLWYTWFHITAKQKAQRLKPDLYFSPELYLSNLPDVLKVAVFHDVAYERHPEILSPLYGWYVRKFSRIYQAQADHILTVSEFNKADIHDVYGTPLDKISVAYNGISEYFEPLPEARRAEIRQQYTGGAPYFLYVGTIQPRKNLSNLFLAFDRFKAETGSDAKLLVVGKKGWQYDEIFATHAAMNYKDEVIFTGPRYGKELNEVYNGALAKTFVPFYEGFGIPIIEAMITEVPVLCANVSCMPEVYGDAAYEVDPFDVEAITTGLKRLASEPKLREDLIAKGHIRHQRYTWDGCYESSWAALEKFL